MRRKNKRIRQAIFVVSAHLVWITIFIVGFSKITVY